MSQVVARYDEFAVFNVNIAAISFGIPYWAQVWMKETNAPFPVWLDPERQSYHAYGLRRSAWQSWGIKNLSFYARAILKGQKLSTEHRGDVHQLGGNFIVDGAGTLRFTYPSRDPTDRPSIEAMLTVLAQIQDRP